MRGTLYNPREMWYHIHNIFRKGDRMEPFVRRSFASAGMTFYICAVLLSFVPQYSDAVAWTFLGLFILYAAYWAILGRRSGTRREVRLFVCSILAAVSLSGFICPGEMPDVPEGEVTVRAEVTERLSSYSAGGTWLVRVTEIGGEMTDLCAAVELDDPSLISGDIITAKAVFGGVSEMAQDSERYLRSHGAKASAVLTDTKYAVSDPSPGSRIALLREQIASKIDSAAGENGYVLRALMIGDRSGLPTRLKLDFAGLGISHLLAISGLHMTVIAGTLMLILSPLGRKRYAVMIPVILIYTALTGFSPSALRAGMMFVIGCIASLIGRRRDALSTLALAVAVICLCDTSVIYDSGFMLSVASVCALLWRGALVRRRRMAKENADDGRSAGEISDSAERERMNRNTHTAAGIIRRIAGAVAGTFIATLAAVLFTFPISAREFGYISAVAPFANLIFIPLVTVIMYAVPVFAVSFLSPTVAGIVGRIIGSVAGLTVRLAGVLADTVGVTVSAKYPLFFPLSVMLVIFCIASATAKKRRAAVIGAVICAAAMTVSAASFGIMRSGEVTVTTENCKSGDLIYVTDGAHLAVIDSASGYTSAATALDEHMKEICLTKTDAYIFTHYHSRDEVYMRKLAGRVRIGKIYLPEPKDSAERSVCQRIMDEAEKVGISAEMYAAGDGFYGNIPFGEAKIRISERCCIGRSTEAIFAAEVSCGEERAVYLSSGFFDAGEAFRRECDIGGAKAYFFGTHGPRSKKEYDLPEDFAPDAVVLPEGTDELFPAMRGVVLHNKGCVFVREGYTVKWDK